MNKKICNRNHFKTELFILTSILKSMTWIKRHGTYCGSSVEWRHRRTRSCNVRNSRPPCWTGTWGIGRTSNRNCLACWSRCCCCTSTVRRCHPVSGDYRSNSGHSDRNSNLKANGHFNFCPKMKSNNKTRQYFLLICLVSVQSSTSISRSAVANNIVRSRVQAARVGVLIPAALPARTHTWLTTTCGWTGTWITIVTIGASEHRDTFNFYRNEANNLN